MRAPLWPLIPATCLTLICVVVRAHGGPHLITLLKSILSCRGSSLRRRSDFLHRDFEQGAVGLLSFPFPKITCSKAYAGREKIVAAFERYYDENGPLSASHFVKALGQASNGYYLSVNNQARLDAVNGHAILANTTPTAFWTLFHMLSEDLFGICWNTRSYGAFWYVGCCC